ncbi:MAG TPA: hypothetical protein DCK79_03330 [Candidatus Atribacteria bacterium]|jgi:uncharacterized membrane protein YkvA (DUF1232 family)|nr:hypothetical protein [Candidatus Atribacteria bacterium]
MFSKWKEKAKKLKQEIYALYLAYKDPRVSWYAKIFIVILVGYAISPIDLIPDFIPIIGYLDDLILLPLGIVLAIKMIPREVMEECRKESTKGIKDKKIAVIGLIIIISIWVVLLYLIFTKVIFYKIKSY